jgi:tetratricopeptide (TPR) repeat protein
MRCKNSFKKVLIVLNVVIFGLIYFAGASIAQKQQIDLADSQTPIDIINQYIYNYNNNTRYDLIDNKLKNKPEDKFLLELKLDMIYGTDLFRFFWNKQDVARSIQVIEKFKEQKINLPKMLLYEGMYYKAKGEWTVARHLLNYSIKEFEKIKTKSPSQNYYYSLALFEYGIIQGNQNYITQAIDQLEKSLQSKPDNVVFLNAINEMFRYIDIPENLYESYKYRIDLYACKLTEIKQDLLLKQADNLFYEKEKLETYYYEEVKKPLTEEILFNWKFAKYVQRSPAQLMYFFQVDKNKNIKNITLIAIDNASTKLIEHTTKSIEESRVPKLPDDYIFETMDYLFIFTYR